MLSLAVDIVTSLSLHDAKFNLSVTCLRQIEAVFLANANVVTSNLPYLHSNVGYVERREITKRRSPKHGNEAGT